MTSKQPDKVLVLGCTGMLGSAVLRFFALRGYHDTVGSARSAEKAALLPQEFRKLLLCGVNVDNVDDLSQLFANVRPTIVINCVGIVKQLSDANDPLTAIPVNSLLPHRLARLCATTGARLVHISTDCVFSGTKGNYVENDLADATDLYGRSKLLGETHHPHAITLRTSIIGHELDGSHGLINWFLGQQGQARGFGSAIFSGLPTVELARVMHDFVIPHPGLHGLYHVSAPAISKHDLLQLVARTYDVDIQIVRDDTLKIDRSLDSTRFRKATGYEPPPWQILVESMHKFG